jgi:hypothetical protein
MSAANKKRGYSTEPRPGVVAAAAKFEGMTRAQLHAARQDAVARRDWLAMQAVTYVMTTTFKGGLE